MVEFQTCAVARFMKGLRGNPQIMTMHRFSSIRLAASLAVLCIGNILLGGAEAPWINLFDGQSLKGWKANENPASWKVIDGALAADGPRSHLFYVGDGNASFKDFEFSADVMTKPGANSGIYFHTTLQNKTWPKQGIEVQVNNSQPRRGNSYEYRKTGSLYGVRNMYKSIVNDNEWFTMRFQVSGKRVRVWLNDTMTVDYVEPDQPMAGMRQLGEGTFALQCHDPSSKVFFKNLRVRPLTSTEVSQAAAPTVDDYYRAVMDFNKNNWPLVNFHAHLKGGLTLPGALEQARTSGINFGVAINCGVNFSITNDAGIDAFLKTMKGQPVFIGMQAEGREWVNMFSPEAVAKFDYVFTDSMTWSNDKGKRMRLWIKDEVEIGDKQKFMDMLVDRAVGILSHEPVDIYVNPTFLPDEIAAEYDTLWTPARMQKVIDAAVKNGVAIEINARYKLPSKAFIMLAKKAGAKFSFGTNNGDSEVGDLKYCFQMVKECGLTADDMFMPKPDGQKPVQIKGFKQ